MAKDDMEIVSELQDLLSDKVGAERYSLWFGTGVCFSIDDDTLAVRSADSFLLERLRNCFREDLEAVGAALLSRTVRVDFQHDPQLARFSRNTEVGSQTGEPTKPSNRPVEQSRPRHVSARRPYARLQDFIEGPENRLALSVADAASQRPGSVNPLFFYGPSGCGKSHLLEGICSTVRKRRQVKHCVYISAEKFTSDFLEALRGGGLPSFRRKHRELDVLLVDDIQFFAGKKATVVELQHTMDSLLRDGRQLVLASDRPPAQLTGVATELTTRMAGGLICPVEPPSYGTRIALLQQIAGKKRLNLAPEIVELIADRIAGDARLLHGAVNRLEATADATDRTIDASMAESTLADLFQCTCRAIQMVDIDRVVCDTFGLETHCLRGKAKTKAVSQPRALAMWLARKYTRAAYSEIGSYFGRRSHSTVISAQKKVNHWVEDGSSIQMTNGDCRVQEALRRIESLLRTG